MIKQKMSAKLAVFLAAGLLSGAQAIADVLNPTIGEVLFEENFNTLDSTIWNSVEGDGCNIGLCGWGNAELQWYSANNLSIVNVPFEPATKALAIEARRQVSGAYQFTSGKITTQDKLQVKYGLIEIRMSTPRVGMGLWPAAWMLGTSPASWPSKGEIDIMEMGHRAQAMTDAGFPGADINSFVGANAIFYASAACSTGNPTCAAMTAWQADNAYVAHTPLVDRFVIYRLYWTDAQLRFTIVDNGVETDLYNGPIAINEEATEFQAPFYLLFNLAVGGNFTDVSVPSQVNAPLPGKMYIDYIRVRKLDGLGEVKIGNPYVPETGTVGVFTDNTPTTKNLLPGVHSDIWIWNTTSVTAGTLPAYEGSNVIAWKYTAPQWFGGGIASRQINDMSNFINGNLKFRIKIPANVGFKIGVRDNYTNENWVNFPAGQTTYGLVRNGDWAQATVPVSAVRGNLIALQAMTTLFSIASLDPLPTSNFEMAIDDIVWECGSSVACQGTTSSSSVGGVSSSKSSIGVSSSRSSSSSSSVIESRPSSSAPRSSSVSSSKSSVSSIVSSSSVPRSSSSSVANSYGHTLAGTSVRFYANNAPWADIHYTVNGGAQQNVRMVNSGTTNTLSVSNIPAGATVRYFYTIGQALGAIDTAWAQFTMPSAASSSSARSSSSVARSSSSAANQSITIQAESYTAMAGVATEGTSDTGGGLNVGWIDATDWMSYANVNIAASGTYKVEYRVASLAGGQLALDLNGGQATLGTINIPATGGWQTWTTISHNVQLTAGTVNLGIYASQGGWNINWFRITKI